MLSHLYKQLNLPSPVTEIHPTWLKNSSCRILVKRDDLIHPLICGNKWRKLKYNLIQAVREDCHYLISFGGAYSNHLVALAEAGRCLGIPTVGIVKSYQKEIVNPSIELMKHAGMHLHFLPPAEFRKVLSSSDTSKNILEDYPDHFVIPQGGTNELSLLGINELLDELADQNVHCDQIICALGTGGTVAGLLRSKQLNSNVIGISPFHSDQIEYDGLKLCTTSELRKLTILQSVVTTKFGGYHRIFI